MGVSRGTPPPRPGSPLYMGVRSCRLPEAWAQGAAPVDTIKLGDGAVICPH